MSSKVASACALLVNEVQKGNPVLQFIKNVKWEFNKDVVPDYVMGQTCAIFVSIKYHYKHPKYVTKRIQEVGRNFRLRVLLVLVDDETNLSAIQDLNKIAFVSDFTLILAWSNIEGARYIETFKSYEGKSSASIQEKEETEYLPKVTKVLGNVRSVNKTDVLTLLDVFDNFSQVCQATEQQLILCPGMGDKKVRRLHSALHQPFIKRQKATEMVASSANRYNGEVSGDFSSTTERRNSSSSGSNAAESFLKIERSDNKSNINSSFNETSGSISNTASELSSQTGAVAKSGDNYSSVDSRNNFSSATVIDLC